MQVILVHSIKDGVVHGTDNEKKTGCGINLTRADKMSSYVKGAPMSDLKEITCEKCKVVLAKRIIKESQKELSRELKDEVKRNTGQRELNSDMYAAAESKPRINKPAEQQGNLSTVSQNKAESVTYNRNTYNITEEKPLNIHTESEPQKFETSVSHKSGFISDIAAKDDILSQFAIPKVMSEDTVEKKSSNTGIMLDDELSKFAIDKPVTDVFKADSITELLSAEDNEDEDEDVQYELNNDEDFEFEKDDDEDEFDYDYEEDDGNISDVFDSTDAASGLIPEEIKPDNVGSSSVYDKDNIVFIEPVSYERKNKYASSVEMDELLSDAEEARLTVRSEIRHEKTITENQSGMQRVNENSDVPRVLYNESGQPMYPVYTAEGQIVYTTVPPVEAVQKTSHAVHQKSAVHEAKEVVAAAASPVKKKNVQESPAYEQSMPKPSVTVQKPAEHVLDTKPSIQPDIEGIIAKNAKRAKYEEPVLLKATAPIVDSIEDALSHLGADIESNNKKDVVPVFTEYKPASAKKTVMDKKLNSVEKKPEPDVPMTKSEMKIRKKLEKIDAEFEKKLKERGFDMDESKRRKRASKI